MNADTVGNTLATHFNTQMAALENSVQIVWDNGPRLAALPSQSSGEWVRYSWRPADDRPAALGGMLYRGVGVIDVQVFTPLGKGQGRSERIARSIQTMFRDQNVGAGIWVRGVSFSHLGEVNGWNQTQVRISITADEPT